MQEFIYHGTQKLRCGDTTGTCAAAAAKAAAILLTTGQAITEVSVTLPGGELRTLPVRTERSGSACIGTVIKDGGDDPDVTNGIAVCARVSPMPSGIEITGGEGVGVVTRPGLDQPVGAAAINSVPRQMISNALREVLHGRTGGFRAEIFVPGGAALARKTYNPRLGIEGGISILGTTGKVLPMSSAALLSTIRAEASVQRAEGHAILLLTPGNYGAQFIRQSLPVPESRAVKCSNFIGEALDIGISLGFKGILLVGHIGKLVKVGAGIFRTHSADADGRMETLAACGLRAGADPAVLRRILDCPTTDAALAVLAEAGCLAPVMEVLTERIAFHLNARVKGAAETGAIIFSFQQELLYQTPAADKLLTQLSEA